MVDGRRLELATSALRTSAGSFERSSSEGLGLSGIDEQRP
jgi:hypothetical protein